MNKFISAEHYALADISKYLEENFKINGVNDNIIVAPNNLDKKECRKLNKELKINTLNYYK
jgi:hypothetical protein